LSRGRLEHVTKEKARFTFSSHFVFCFSDKEDLIRRASVVLCTNSCSASLGEQKFPIHIIDEASTSSLASVIACVVGLFYFDSVSGFGWNGAME